MIMYLGPCSIESEEQVEKIILFLQTKNVDFVLRGGLFKLRTDPSSFQGLREEGVSIISKLKEKYKFKYATEISSLEQYHQVKDIADEFQIGTRSMYNYELLSFLGKQEKPVLLKRGFSATLEEWIGAAEYITKGGNKNVIMCERGVRSFEPKFRNMVDLTGALYVKKNTPFKVILDPSHGTGGTEYVAELTNAAIVSKLDGFMIEMHPEPEKAQSDKMQANSFAQIERIIKNVTKIKRIVDDLD